MAPTVVYYNMTALFNSTTSSNNTFVSMMQFVSNPTTSGNFLFPYIIGALIMMAIFVVILLSLTLRGYSFISALTTAVIVNFVVAMLLYPLSIISGWLLVISVLRIPIMGFVVFYYSQ